MATLAVDLGGTHMRVTVVADDGSIRDRAHAPTPAGAEKIDAFVDLISRVRARDVDHAVVGVPGRVDHDTGVLLHAPNLPPAWFAQVTRGVLEAALDLPVVLANDADVAAVGEAYFGAGRGHRDVAYVTVSTGVGAGVVIDGQLVLPRFSGGEIGHTVVDRVAAAAGRPATVEELGSGPALARQARERGLDVDGSGLVDRVRADDPAAVAVWRDAMDAVGFGIANLVHVVAPTVVVIGGGVGRNGDLVLEPVRAAIARYGPEGPPPAVVGAALGDDPGLIGAAAWRRATRGRG